MCTVDGRIGWIGTRSGTARRPGIAGPTTPAIEYKELSGNCKPLPSIDEQEMVNVKASNEKVNFF